MKKVSRPPIFTAVMLITFVCFMRSAYSQTDATDEVLQTARRYQTAGIRGDAQALSDIFDTNITHIHPGEAYRFVGRERLVQEFVTAAARMEKPSFEMLEPRVQFASPDAAVLTYYISERWLENGNARRVSEKATEVYVRRNAKWIMIHSHYSLNP
jgi:uncharacterized protein (TIGR02246 family)